MQEKIKKLIEGALKNLGIEEIDFVVEHPEDLINGDYSTNVAMVCAKNFKQNPKELAEKIVGTLRQAQGEFPEIQEIQVAGAGFINFFLSPKFFHGSIEEILNNEDFARNRTLQNKKIMVEYTDPNPFKPFHIGHLMTNAIGESIARILESSGADVSRANYQGDIGLHVAKAIWGLQKRGLPNPDLSTAEKANYIGECYSLGAGEYGPIRLGDEEKESPVKVEIDEINKKIYDRTDAKINKIYEWGFKVTMEAFEDLYRILGTKFDFYFLESEVAQIGENIVRDNVGKVFKESDGAIIFKGEEHDPKLHTRVFITSTGLPTYETKELGLAEKKFRMNPNMNLSLVITANEQADYMRVVAKALSLIHLEYTDKMRHITHGMMRLARGATAEGLASGKMSSRKGNVVTGESLLRDTIALVSEKVKDREWDEEKKKKISEQVGVSAIKYSILKQSTGGDIAFDFEKSISFEGDSGPYLQYSYARANSVIEKARGENILPDPHLQAGNNVVFEVEKLLYRFPEIVSRSAAEYEPHYIANYLIELARAFNSFYGNTVIVDKEDKTSPYKVALTFAFTFVMKKGLHLLGIEAPEKM
ncbi:arginine--tRNA ligase [Candidatus Nomurabacteria bacterium RIFCSPLOWO2_01_FULL_39_18]|uniref:Arginine--tRNA ligase n=1 Tax=Candidatus Nomurabacteria bacterium RIFCSPHIGHO2_01_FULL_40_24b TaxID=1801739 RepID=A0A1F6V801_9BACT|nr:MAG: arginine--tRNA ligase [Candidatus Nomurabacteria bacterium RIFCSPHIGHO2_01_FULL_40_24b]OGI88965.1 MAG: arginine--tRNA ligase [Candidatus Nomurabacteria bacterium RIFCSPLOWO2_01_FULL_39_18]